MNSLLLSSLTKDFLNQDPDTVLPAQLYRLGWSRSSLISHPRARTSSEKRAITFGAFILALKEKLSNLFEEENDPAVFLSTSPKLGAPILAKPGTYRPARYFSKGGLDADRQKTPTPIPYLLSETNETLQPRPIPGNSLLLRSLCKGKGVLRQNKQGLVYLDIDNRFILSLIPYLKAYGLIKPPYFNLFGAPDGAHIPVIPAREIAFQYLDKIEELDREFTFEIEGLYSIEPAIWPEVEQVWFFKIRSPELEKLRKSYFLPTLPSGHSFHIAVAIKPRALAGQLRPPLPMMRINVAFLAA
ncbi:MAG: hypothetical protein V4487_07130 [Chlamydiota bacterium]